MQHRQIKEQLGKLEEQLELLGSSARSNAAAGPVSDSLRHTLRTFYSLHDLLHDQSLKKSLEAGEFLRRIVGVVMQEAASLGYEVAVTYHGDGRISSEMIEVSMGAIVACLKASLRSYRGMSQASRMQKFLFNTYSIYLEVQATAEMLQFRLLDDGKGYETGFLLGGDTEAQFQRLRGQVAKYGGWFTKRSLEKYGGVVEFRLPLPRARFECRLLSSGGAKVLLPDSYVAKVIEASGWDEIGAADGERVTVPCTTHGLRIVDSSNAPAFTRAIKVGVADFQFWILCDRLGDCVKARPFAGEDFIEPGAWFQSFGIFLRGEHQQLAPLLEGDRLLRLFGEWGGKNAGI